MKNNKILSKIGVLLSLLITFSVQAEEVLPNERYLIRSDVFSDTIPKGKCLVMGKAQEMYSGGPIAGGLVGEPSYIRNTKTKADGTYSLLLNATDSTLYFHHADYGEVVVWNYDFKSQHIVTIDFSFEAYNQDIMPVAEKPVIYLYADHPIAAKLSLKPMGKMTFTYPAYDQSWQVNVGTNNEIEVDGQNYPYLFWEADLNALNFNYANNQLEGFYIKTDTCIQFLENVLMELGLNATEQTDFITYWGPRLTQHNFATIQFLVDDAYDKEIAELNIIPKPDVQRRVYMIFKGSELGFSPVNIKTPSFSDFKRSGFTLLEWGGTEISGVNELN